MAVGTSRRLAVRINSPKPGNILSHTRSVASGVTSLGAGPVPPVVSMREQCSTSASSANAISIADFSSGTMRRMAYQGDISISVSAASMPGPPLSSYSPLLARSDMVSIPIGALLAAGWFIVKAPENQ